MSEEVFKAVIAAQDQTAATFEAIIARLHKVEQAAAGASKHTHELTEHGGRFHELSEHVHELGEHFGELREHIGEAVEKAVELLPALGALGGAGSLVGLFEMTEHASEAFAEFNAQALKLGISRQQLSGLSLAAQMTDVPVEKLSAGLAKLSLTMGEVSAGKSKEAEALFHHLGIELHDAHGKALNVADVMPELAEAFKHTTDATMRSRMAAALFGARLGKDLLPMLLEGKDGLEEFATQAKELRYAVTPEDAEGLEHYHRSMIGLTTAVGGFTTELAAKLAPALDPIVEGTRDWIVANRDWITQNIAERVDALVTALGHVDWAGWAAEAHQIGDAMAWVHDKIGDVGVAIIGVTAIMWSNPWLAAIGGLILAAQEIHDHWGPIKDFFADLWAGITAAFDAAWAKIKPIVDALRDAVNWIGQHVPGGGGASVTSSISTYIDEHTRQRTLPGPRASSDRHDAEEGGNRHVIANWVHDLFVRPGDGGDDTSGWNAPALAAPPAILTAPTTALAPPSAAPQGPAPQLEMHVVFDNAPDGMRVSTTGNSFAPLPVIDVGHAMPGFGH